MSDVICAQASMISCIIHHLSHTKKQSAFARPFCDRSFVPDIACLFAYLLAGSPLNGTRQPASQGEETKNTKGKEGKGCHFLEERALGMNSHCHVLRAEGVLQCYELWLCRRPMSRPPGHNNLGTTNTCGPCRERKKERKKKEKDITHGRR